MGTNVLDPFAECTCGWISRGYLTERAAVEAHRSHWAGLSEGGERA